MPWNVRLEDEKAKVLDEVQTIFGFIKAGTESDSSILAVIDPYGDTVFNRLQVGRLLQEWLKLETAAKAASQLEKWNAVKLLLQRSQSEPHTYVRFVGD